VIGNALFPQLAKHFVATRPMIDEFAAGHAAPWIAKVYRPSVTELAKNLDALGSVSLWYPSEQN